MVGSESLSMSGGGAPSGLRGIVALLALACFACGSSDDENRGCRQDKECPATQACLASACVPKLVALYNLAAIVVPSLGSGARTEIGEQTFSSGETTLRIEPSVQLEGQAKAAENAPFSSVSQGELSLTFSLPSMVRGQPPVELSAVGQVGPTPGEATFKVSVPQSWLEPRIAKVLVTPRVPIDLVLPPIERPELQLVPNMLIRLPEFKELRAVVGLVRNAFDQPALDYSVRVFRGSVLVSTTAVLLPDGRFRVSYLSEAPPELAGVPATLEVSPRSFGARPRLRLQLDENTLDVGTLRLPAQPIAQRFRIPVVSTNASGQVVPVAGAVVRLETRLSSAPAAPSAFFIQAAQAGAEGVVEVPLIPGGFEAVRVYQLEVVSPPGSEAASRCVDRLDIGPGISVGTSVPTTATIQLSRRPMLSGLIKHADLSPLQRALVTAVRVAPLPGSDACQAASRWDAASVPTQSDGGFAIPVEPGIYRLEIRPPASDPTPLWFATDVMVTNEGVVLALQLPEGRVLDARVLRSDGLACQICSVRLFDASLEGAAILRAEAVTDYEGRFRTVVPPI